MAQLASRSSFVHEAASNAFVVLSDSDSRMSVNVSADIQSHLIWLPQAESNATGIVVAAACLLTVGVVMAASAGANLDELVITWQFWKSLWPAGDFQRASLR
ncbi:MAG: hypothetical protein R3E58_01600 [Phycisphaerae bacterium]